MTKIFLLAFLFSLLSGSANGQNLRLDIDFTVCAAFRDQARQALQLRSEPVAQIDHKGAKSLGSLAKRQARHLVLFVRSGQEHSLFGIEKRRTLRCIRTAPKGAIRFARNNVQAGHAFYDALTKGVQKGDAGEDYSQGHTLSSYPEARALQERFNTFAAQDLKLPSRRLHQSADSGQRALAAQIIAYAADKREIVKDLVYRNERPEWRCAHIRCVRSQSLPASRNDFPDNESKFPSSRLSTCSLHCLDDRTSLVALYQHSPQQRNPALLSSCVNVPCPRSSKCRAGRVPGHAFRPLLPSGSRR